MNYLKCPVCQEALSLDDKKASCINNHHFDKARQGYLNLFLSQRVAHGDNALLSKARDEFLSQGYYDFLIKRISDLLSPYQPKSIIDLGCGQGHYLSYLVNSLKLETSCGIELSKDALKIASRKDKHSLYCIASLAHVPVLDHTFDVALNMFAPKVSEEVDRILKTNGLWLCVDVAEKHLIEMKEKLYDEVYLNSDEIKQFEGFKVIYDEVITHQVEIKQPYLTHLFEMTPYRFKTSPDRFSAIYDCESLLMTLSFIIKVYQKEK